MKQNNSDRKDFLRRTAAIAVPAALQNLLTTTGSMIDKPVTPAVQKALENWKQ